MLSTPQAAREVFFAPDGVLAGMGVRPFDDGKEEGGHRRAHTDSDTDTLSRIPQPGKALVDCATLEVKDMQEFDAAVKGKGGRFLEAPVSGSKVPAEQVSQWPSPLVILRVA